jgi:phenylalanyl-tRNA synthetase beta chain
VIISMDWIKDFVAVDPKLSNRDISQRLTLATCEVESATEVGGHLQMIRVVKIVSVRKHPSADSLNLVTFELQAEGAAGAAAATKEVVCGAPNVRAGLKVPYAPLGTTLPGGLTLAAKAIRGVVSEGMLCSAAELGISSEASGLLELDGQAPVGMAIGEYLKEKSDLLLDIDNKSLTHRPDLWGHLGMAREFSCLLNTPFKNRYTADWEAGLEMKWKAAAKGSAQASPIIPKFEGPSACKGYVGISLFGVKVGTSPDWMQKRLINCGLRPINSIVDISNYAMLELGFPNHIFDFDQIASGQIVVRRARPEECGAEKAFVTLDGVERPLLPTDTVVCDGRGPLVLAGIMGGKNCGVTENTTRLFIEVANWIPEEVRKTSTRLGLRTDSSQRYEKGMDTKLLKRTLLRVVELVQELCPGSQVQGQVESWLVEEEKQRRPLVLTTTHTKIDQLLGKKIPHEEVRRIFTMLDFKILPKSKGDELVLEVPSYRATKDIEMEADLIEEIGRMVGFDNIGPHSPQSPIKVTKLMPKQKLHRKLRDFVVLNAKAFEIYTYPLVGEAILKKSAWPVLNEQYILANPLSKECDRLRPSIIPSVMEKIHHNHKSYESFSLFELGRAYSAGAGSNFVTETNQLLLASYHKKKNRFVDVANAMESLLVHLGIQGELVRVGTPKLGKQVNSYFPKEWEGLHPVEFCHLMVRGKIVGGITSIHPTLKNGMKLKGEVSLAVLDLASFEEAPIKEKTGYHPLPKFPSATFDCTVLVAKKINVEDILASLKKVKLKEMIREKVITVFPLNENEKAVTLRCLFRDDEKTLTPEFIKMAEEKVMKTLDEAGYPLKLA